MKIEDILVRGTESVRTALGRIDAGAIQMALVVDDESRLIGTLSDGDIRRGLLRGVSLESSVLECVNRNPRSVRVGTSDADVLALLKRAHLHQMPVVDADNRIVDLKVLDDLIDSPERPNIVVLMVGGLGRRLGELTRNTPKPMLPVGGKPLLATILNVFCEQGFRNFRFAVNYMSDTIEQYFGDGSDFDCHIEYLREPRRLGTAGALSLLNDRSEFPLLVSNGDLLLRMDFGALLDYHVSSGAQATMAVREFDYQVPYGVVCADGDKITGLKEKPTQRFLISGGLYVLSPDVVSRVPRNTFYDMPTLFNEVVATGARASAYKIDGYWLDIGQFADYEQAQREFTKVFASE